VIFRTCQGAVLVRESGGSVATKLGRQGADSCHPSQQVSHVWGRSGWGRAKSERATILARVRPLSLARHSSYRGRLMPCSTPFPIASLLLFGVPLALEEGYAHSIAFVGAKLSRWGQSRSPGPVRVHYVDVELVPEDTQSRLVASEQSGRVCCCLELEGCQWFKVLNSSSRDQQECRTGLGGRPVVELAGRRHGIDSLFP
jgi:hypothetical protein